MVLSQVSVPAQTMDVNRAGSVSTSYEDAYNRAGQEGKPILVLFTTQSQPSELQALRSNGLMNDYIVVVADRNTDAGRKIASTFNFTAPEGVSVIERTRQWQFARYEHKLNGEQLTKVATACRTAAGYPTFDPLAANVSAYPPPAQGQAGQPAGAQPAGVQPTIQYFQPTFPMMWGGGCPGGNCGSGGCANGRCGR
jgi:hypothetical protein